MKSLDFKKSFFKIYSRYQRRNVAEVTKSYFAEILENAEHGERIKQGIKATHFYEKTFPLRFGISSDPNRHYETVLRFHDGDTLDVALQLQRDGFNPCVLNFASHSRPGGGWMTGARAQEEELFLRSTYDLSLSDSAKVDVDRKWSYPIPEMGGIYSPDMFVFRSNERNEYKVLDWNKCRYVSFVAVAALRHPKLEHGRFTHRDAFITREKIKTILRIAAMNGHSSILLGAFGCGAFCNPPQHMAELFADVFASHEFQGRFERIDFAILDVEEGVSNYDIFKRVLCPKGKERAEPYEDVIYNPVQTPPRIIKRYPSYASVVRVDDAHDEWCLRNKGNEGYDFVPESMEMTTLPGPIV